MIVPIVLFIAGIMLILSEFFLPGAIMGILGFLLIVVSTVTGVAQYPEYALFIIVGEVLGLVGGILFGLYLITKTPLQDALVLDMTLSAEEGYSGPSMDPALVGQVARVHTALRPAGTIMLGDERIDAVSDGTFIDAGRSVRVIQVEGHRVVVEEDEGGVESEQDT
ncbi:MAG: NfeD family protein [Candidatus Hydrogenedentota bacterium]